MTNICELNVQVVRALNTLAKASRDSCYDIGSSYHFQPQDGPVLHASYYPGSDRIMIEIVGIRNVFVGREDTRRCEQWLEQLDQETQKSS